MEVLITVADFLNLLKSIFTGIYNLLINENIQNILGANLFQILVAFFIVWMTFRIFIARDDYSPGQSMFGRVLDMIPPAVSVRPAKNSREIQTTNSTEVQK